MTQNPNPNQLPQKPRQVRLEIPAKLDAIYSNAVIISQTHSEIIMDFAQFMPNTPQARVQSRIVMTPANAKSFLQALQTNLQNFETKHGEIPMPPKPQSLADQLFSAIKNEDENDEGEDEQA